MRFPLHHLADDASICPSTSQVRDKPTVKFIQRLHAELPFAPPHPELHGKSDKHRMRQIILPARLSPIAVGTAGIKAEIRYSIPEHSDIAPISPATTKAAQCRSLFSCLLGVETLVTVLSIPLSGASQRRNSLRCGRPSARQPQTAGRSPSPRSDGGPPRPMRRISAQ